MLKSKAPSKSTIDYQNKNRSWELFRDYYYNYYIGLCLSLVADRFYNDFSLLNIWDSNGVYFVVRHKENIQYTVIKENELPDNRHQHLLKDEIIELTGVQSKNKYPKKLRRVAIWEDKNEQVIEVNVLDSKYTLSWGVVW